MISLHFHKFDIYFLKMQCQVRAKEIVDLKKKLPAQQSVCYLGPDHVQVYCWNKFFGLVCQLLSTAGLYKENI